MPVFKVTLAGTRFYYGVKNRVTCDLVITTDSPRDALLQAMGCTEGPIQEVHIDRATIREVAPKALTRKQKGAHL
jgi:hypothetical protein